MEEHWKKIIPKMVLKINKKHTYAIDANIKEALFKYRITINADK